jgi:predicted PurR-regulated permease PerM
LTTTPAAPPSNEPSARTIVRIALIVVLSALAVYQQLENYVVQPRIQSKAVSLDPFMVIIAALVGGTLLGVLGALLAIPAAATIQISVREYLAFRRERATAGAPSAPPAAV